MSILQKDLSKFFTVNFPGNSYLNWLFRRTKVFSNFNGCSEEPKVFSNFNEVVQHVIDEERNLDLFASVCSTVWYRRDEIRLKHSVYPISQMLLQASQALQDFLHVPPAQPSVTSPRVRWIPSPASSLKVNFDGALYKDINAAGVGVVVRDHRGLVLASWAENVCLTPTSDDVEAMAAAKAITFAFELGLSSVVERDSEIIIKALRSEDRVVCYPWTLNFYCKLSMDAFCSISFSY